MNRNPVETIIGAVVLVVAALVLVFAYTSASLRPVRGYEVLAKFDRIDGLQVGTDVRISGIKVGTVVSLVLEPASFLAVARLSISDTVKLPKDTVAQISSEGLLGGKFMALVPGGDTAMIKPGGEISFTQSPVNLEDLIGQLIFSQGGGKDGAKDGAKPAAGSVN